MGTRFLLKLILLPVLLCFGLAVTQAQGMISYRLFCEVFCCYTEPKEAAKTRTTIVDDKIRMNN